MAAGRNDTRLEDLFDAFAAHLSERLKGEKAITKDGEAVTLPCSPAILKEIRQFLLDNDIKGLPVPGSPMGNLTANLPFPSK